MISFRQYAKSNRTKESTTSSIELPEDEPMVVAKMIEFLYTASYRNTDTSNTTTEELYELGLHAKLYAIADKYGIDGLAVESKSIFLAATQTSWNGQEFLRSIPSIYNLTPESNRGLRDIAVSCTRLHSKELSTEVELQELWKDVSLQAPLYSIDVVDSFLKAPLLGHCHSCGPDQVVDALQLRCRRCGKGGAYCRPK